jgi:hypothetical protein
MLAENMHKGVGASNHQPFYMRKVHEMRGSLPLLKDFLKKLAKIARSLSLNKSRVVGGSLNKSKFTDIFNDEKIDLARKVEAICPASAITITELWSFLFQSARLERCARKSK